MEELVQASFEDIEDARSALSKYFNGHRMGDVVDMTGVHWRLGIQSVGWWEPDEYEEGDYSCTYSNELSRHSHVVEKDDYTFVSHIRDDYGGSYSGIFENSLRAD